MADFFKTMGDSWNTVTKSIEKEFKRIPNEMDQNIRKDAQQISQGVERGGFLGGIVEAADVFSPGHQVVSLLDSFNVVPEDEALQEGISAGINLGAGVLLGTGPTAFLTPALVLLAAKDASDAMNAGNSSAPNQRAQTPHSPGEARRAREGGSRTDCVVQHGCSDSCRTGFRVDLSEVSQGIRYGDMIERIRDNLTGRKDIDSEIDRILSNPNLCFEDMIFLLMRVVIRAGKDETTDLARELRGSRDGNRARRDALSQEIAELRGKLASEQDPKKADNLRNQLNGKIEDRADLVNDSAESRAEIAESLKNAMQRISEMEQALSNILNTQHETAMAAIRNIR